MTMGKVQRSFHFRKHINVTPFMIVIGFLLLIYGIGLVALFLWAINTSLKDNDNFIRDPLWLTSSWDFANYVTVFEKMTVQVNTSGGGKKELGLEMMFLYSFLYAGGCALIQTLTTATVAYLTARYKNVFSKILHLVVIATLILPIVGNTASLLQVMKDLHLYDTMIGSWIMKVGFNNIYYLVFYAAFSSIPHDYEESAKVDGASHFKIYTNVMFPMVAPLFWTIALLLFINYWNDYQGPYLFMPDLPTASLGLFYFLKNTVTEVSSVSVKVSSGLIVFIPIFIVFLIFRNRIMESINEGGIKE